MEKMSHPTPAYLVIDENEFAFSDKGEIAFRVFPKGEALTSGNVFIVDIYAADDHSHPNGHAGWWEYTINDGAAVEVLVTCAKAGLTVSFNGAPTQTYWHNNEFNAEKQTLIMHLVVREWRSTTIIFDDPILVFPDEEKKAHYKVLSLNKIPLDTPNRWFVWPQKRKVLLVFNILSSQSTCRLCNQLSQLLLNNEIPFSIYAHRYNAKQRKEVRPVEYLLHEYHNDDIILFVFSEGGEVLPLVASLQCKKILYHRHLPDHRRYQAFDAEFARSLAEVQEQEEAILAFDGICYESEYTSNTVESTLRNFLQKKLKKEWEIGRLVSNNSTHHTKEHLFCTLPNNRPAFLPQQLEITVSRPQLPKPLGIFPPALWREAWETIQAQPSAVPTNFILSVGSFRPDKHHEDVLRIFASLAPKDTSVGLVIAGWPAINGYWDYIRFLREKTYEHLQNRIVFLLGCNSGQLRWLYENAKLFLSACSEECYSYSIIDALFFNLPIVLRRTHSATNILDTCGIQFEQDTPTEYIADDIIRILTDKNFREKIIQSQNIRKSCSPIQYGAKSLLRVLQAATQQICYK